jgi:hypothetical protein
VTNPSRRFTLKSEGGSELATLATGDVVTLGRDPRNRVQIGHGSIEPFHARLRCDDWGLWITPLEGARVVVEGEPTNEERAVPFGAAVELGSLRFGLQVQELAAAETPALSPGTSRALQWFDSALGFVGSVMIHGVVLWLVARYAVGQLDRSTEGDGSIAMLLNPASDRGEEPTLESPEAPALPTIVPMDPKIDELPTFDPDATVVAPSFPPPADTTALPNEFDATSGPYTLGVGGAVGPGGLSGSGRRSGLMGTGRLDLGADSGLGRGFVGRLKALRGSGVDLVIVIDTTSSMRPFLEGAREAADTLVSRLATIVEDLRVAVVAYRDAGDEYETKMLPLGGDRYAILNFLWSLRAEGGGDAPEAVAEGLESAIRKAGWRPRSHRVVVVVGDAPPHMQDWSKMKSLIAGYSRGDGVPGAVVSAIYTGPPREKAATAEEDGAAALAEIARMGHGDYVDLAGANDMGERLLLLVLGPKHAAELQILLSKVRDGPREQLIRKHISKGDKAWLLARLRHPPVHPAVVNSLIELGDREVLWEARKLIADSEVPRGSREAALYILRRCLPQASELDLDRALESQRGILNRLDALIFRR